MLQFIHNKKGQSAIELAIIFPVMAFLMIYLFDVAKVVNAKMTINTANRAFVRIVTINGAPEHPEDYHYGLVSELKNNKTGRNIADTAKLAAMSILSQNNLELVDKDEYLISPNYKRSIRFLDEKKIPLSGTINFHDVTNSPDTSYGFASKMCTEVPINLSKIMNIEIWGKGKVKNGKLPVCSIYVSAISSRESKKKP